MYGNILDTSNEPRRPEHEDKQVDTTRRREADDAKTQTLGGPVTPLRWDC